MKEKKKFYKNKSFWKKTIAIALVFLTIVGILTAVIFAGTSISIETAAAYHTVKEIASEWEATDYGFKMTKKDEEPFRILMLTDVHIGAGIFSVYNDKLALTAVGEIVSHVKPDLIVVTGDIAYPIPAQAGTLNNLRAAEIFAKLMENLGVPWTLTLGNHDTEDYSRYTRADITKFYQDAPLCLFRRGPEDITGYGNQIITLHNKDGEMNTALVLLDSNEYYAGGRKISRYDIIHDDQLEWYTSEIIRISEGRESLVPSMMFFHIPVEEYRTAYDLYQAGDPGVQWWYGERREKVASASIPCNTFETILELGSTTAVFCGHDHVNDFSITYKGIRLTYGKSIDYLAYAWSGILKQTEQRGGTIIDLNPDASYTIKPIKLTDIQNAKE